MASAAPQTTASITNFIPVKLSEDNYMEWKPLLSTFLHSHGLLGYVDGTIPCPSADDFFYSNWCRTDEDIRSCLFATITEPLLREVRDLPSAKAVCDALHARDVLRSRAPQQQEIAQGQQDDECPQLPNKRRLHEVIREVHHDSEASSVSEYEVFLSFRGPDSRYCLCDVLYSDMTTAGICVFRDEDELEIGDKINKILASLDKSKICVPIFSQTFAASTWCLREIERMVELGKEIMPIFYKVAPDDVKLKTDLFKKDLSEHVEKYGPERVKKWEDALKVVARIKGSIVHRIGFTEFSRSFVKALCIKLKFKQEYVTDFLVKRDDQEEDLMKLLDIKGDYARLVVGIHGMGGVGKTTLAKVVFNQLSARFHCRSFLENIQESIELPKGLENLQKRLLEDLDPKLKGVSVTDPMNMLKEKFTNRKVLIVLDDVKERKHVGMIVGVIDHFGSGSRIIITSRDTRVFTEGARPYELHEMNQDQTLQLFSRHAFGKDSPPKDWKILSDKAILLTGRLPLALEVIGSRLYGCDDEEIWEVTIEKLKKNSDQGVLGKLRISFDALDDQEKQIFLDISCFFVNKERMRAMYMWEDCGLFPVLGIRVLASMSLLKITEKDKFWMHDLVRDLGRVIVREKYPDEPVKWSRIWSHTEAVEVLKIKKGKEEVKGLTLEKAYFGRLTNEEFSSFSNLRFLKLVGTNLVGDFNHTPLPQLRWFSWHRCPSHFTPANLHLEKLVILELHRGDITENWAGWGQIQRAKNLKVLDLTLCHRLERIPNLSNNKALEKLILKDCSSLVEIHSSIGRLKRLKHLRVEHCSSLIRFPEEICSLGNLEEIVFRGNGNSTFHVPGSIGCLHSLSVIQLHRVMITGIPQFLGKLVNLTVLSMQGCEGIEVLPDIIGDLKSLIKLDLSGTKLSALPNSVGRLTKLQSLCLQDTEITELPNEVGDLKSLCELHMSQTKVSMLPDSIGQLDKLEKLYLDGTRIEELPNTFRHLASLKELSIRWTRLKELPDSLEALKSLEKLYLTGTPLRILPDWVRDSKQFLHLEWPSSLRDLAMFEHYAVSLPAVGSKTDLSRLISLSLKDLTASSVSTFPTMINQLTSLRSLDIGFLSDEVHGSGSTSLPASLDLGALTLLLELKLDCLHLKCIPQLPPALEELTLLRVAPATKLPDFSNLKNLVSITFEDCSPNNVHELESLWEVLSLVLVKVRNCTKELVEFCRKRNVEAMGELSLFVDDIFQY